MSHLTNKSINKRNGFTLIELLIVVAILGILYSVALPSYTEHMERSRRADIQQVLLQHGAVLERIYSRNGGYPNSFTPADTEYYSFSYAPSDRVPGSAAATDFKSRQYALNATPKPSSAQAGDRCGVLTIEHDGKQSAKKGNAIISHCWD